jgi:hypothetical protein
MAYDNPIGMIPGVVAGADLSTKQFTFAKVHTDGTIIGVSTGGVPVAGVIQDKPTSGQAVAVATLGLSKVKAGALVAKGAIVTPDVNGKAVTAGTGDFGAGIALTNAANADELITVLLKDLGPQA